MLSIIAYNCSDMDGVCAALIVTNECKRHDDHVVFMPETKELNMTALTKRVQRYVNDDGTADGVNIFVIGLSLSKEIIEKFGKYITYIDNDHLRIRKITEYMELIGCCQFGYRSTVCTMWDGIITKLVSLGHLTWSKFSPNIETPLIVDLCAEYTSYKELRDTYNDPKFVGFRTFINAIGVNNFVTEMKDSAWWHICCEFIPVEHRVREAHILNILDLLEAPLQKVSPEREKLANDWLLKAIDTGSKINELLNSFEPRQYPNSW